MYNTRNNCGENGNEIFNHVNFLSKCFAFTFTTSLQNFKKKLIGNNDDNSNSDDIKIKFVAETELTTIGAKLFDAMKINIDCSDLAQITYTEYCFRITFLAFIEKKIRKIELKTIWIILFVVKGIEAYYLHMVYHLL